MLGHVDPFLLMTQSGICTMNIPSLGPLVIERANGTKASNCGGDQSSTKETKLNQECDLFSTFHLAALVLLLTLPWLS